MRFDISNFFNAVLKNFWSYLPWSDATLRQAVTLPHNKTVFSGTLFDVFRRPFIRGAAAFVMGSAAAVIAVDKAQAGYGDGICVQKTITGKINTQATVDRAGNDGGILSGITHFFSGGEEAKPTIKANVDAAGICQSKHNKHVIYYGATDDGGVQHWVKQAAKLRHDRRSGFVGKAIVHWQTGELLAGPADIAKAEAELGYKKAPTRVAAKPVKQKPVVQVAKAKPATHVASKAQSPRASKTALAAQKAKPKVANTQAAVVKAAPAKVASAVRNVRTVPTQPVTVPAATVAPVTRQVAVQPVMMTTQAAIDLVNAARIRQAFATLQAHENLDRAIRVKALAAAPKADHVDRAVVAAEASTKVIEVQKPLSTHASAMRFDAKLYTDSWAAHLASAEVAGLGHIAHQSALTRWEKFSPVTHLAASAPLQGQAAVTWTQLSPVSVQDISFNMHTRFAAEHLNPERTLVKRAAIAVKNAFDFTLTSVQQNIADRLELAKTTTARTAIGIDSALQSWGTKTAERALPPVIEFKDAVTRQASLWRSMGRRGLDYFAQQYQLTHTNVVEAAQTVHDTLREWAPPRLTGSINISGRIFEMMKASPSVSSAFDGQPLSAYTQDKQVPTAAAPAPVKASAAQPAIVNSGRVVSQIIVHQLDQAKAKLAPKLEGLVATGYIIGEGGHKIFTYPVKAVNTALAALPAWRPLVAEAATIAKPVMQPVGNMDSVFGHAFQFAEFEKSIGHVAQTNIAMRNLEADLAKQAAKVAQISQAQRNFSVLVAALDNRFVARSEPTSAPMALADVFKLDEQNRPVSTNLMRHGIMAYAPVVLPTTVNDAASAPAILSPGSAEFVATVVSPAAPVQPQFAASAWFGQFFNNMLDKLKGWKNDEEQLVSRIMDAVKMRESADCRDTTGPDMGGGRGSATGCWQVMPENVRPWAQEALGRDISKKEFDGNVDLQKQVVRHKMRQYVQQAKALGMNTDEQIAKHVASMWHSGVDLATARAQNRNDRSTCTVDYAAQVHEIIQTGEYHMGRPSCRLPGMKATVFAAARHHGEHVKVAFRATGKHLAAWHAKLPSRAHLAHWRGPRKVHVAHR